jgi:hypothetical protein
VAGALFYGWFNDAKECLGNEIKLDWGRLLKFASLRLVL